jgi:parvulin-like peptidyl-prolyl isomerase
MTSRIAQRTVVCLAAMAALLFATACDSPVDPPAAKVDDISISRDELFNEAEALAALPDDPYGFQADTNNALNAAMVANVLSAHIAGAIYDVQAERMGLVLDPAAVDAARQEVGQSLSGLPDDVMDDIARRAATREMVEQHVANEQWWTDADIERYHELTKERICVRHIVVETEAEAEVIVDQLGDGSDFADLAAEHSIDEATAADGGNLGCPPMRAFPDPLRDALDDAESGELVGPVSAGGGVYVFLVDEAPHEVPLDDAARAEIEERFADPRGSGWADYVLRTTQVDVDPRFGSWDALAGQVVPPQGAQPAPTAGALTVE